jgi:hypothetical protein
VYLVDLPPSGSGDSIKFYTSNGFLYVGIFAITFRLYKVHIMSVVFSIGLYKKIFAIVVRHSRVVSLLYASEFYKIFGVFYCMDRTLYVNNIPY